MFKAVYIQRTHNYNGSKINNALNLWLIAMYIPLPTCIIKQLTARVRNPVAKPMIVTALTCIIKQLTAGVRNPVAKPTIVTGLSVCTRTYLTQTHNKFAV